MESPDPESPSRHSGGTEGGSPCAEWLAGTPTDMELVLRDFWLCDVDRTVGGNSGGSPWDGRSECERSQGGWSREDGSAASEGGSLLLSMGINSAFSSSYNVINYTQKNKLHLIDSYSFPRV